MAAGGATIMITNGGTHPARKWAEVIANELVDVADNAPQEMHIAGAQLREFIMDAVTPYIEHAQDLKLDGHHDIPDVADLHVEQMITSIKEAAAKTAFGAHFDQDHVLEYMLDRLGLHTRTALMNEIDHAAALAEATTANEKV